MKFEVSSSQLLHSLASISRVIAPKPAISILENFLFVLKDTVLTVTASDGETTLRTSIEVERVHEEGSVAIQAKRLTDALKEFPDLPLTFSTESDNAMVISWASGKSKIPVFAAEDFPQLAPLQEGSHSIEIAADILLGGINDTIYATAEEELRPVMNGIYFDFEPERLSMVASDAHKLVCYTVSLPASAEKASFILHKKPASILKNLLSKVNGEVSVQYDARNAYFTFDNTLLVCRLIEGNYPAYRSVIPKNNPNKMIIGRVDMLNSVRRVAICSNQSTNHVVLKLTAGQMMISAEDTSFSMSSYEKLPCQYDGDEMEIGFKAPFLTEILSNLPYENICMELADSCRAALIVSADGKNPDDDLCALLMPIMINV